jgi:L-lactate dehydrogenase complex protein LldF
MLPDYQEPGTSQRPEEATLDNLDYYLEQFETNVTAQGKVVWCGTQQAADFLVRLAKEKGARLLVKVKSMTGEEIDERAPPASWAGGSRRTRGVHRGGELAPYHIVAPS